MRLLQSFQNLLTHAQPASGAAVAHPEMHTAPEKTGLQGSRAPDAAFHQKKTSLLSRARVMSRLYPGSNSSSRPIPQRTVSSSSNLARPNVYQDINHRQWDPLPPQMQNFATGRMQKTMAQKEHLNGLDKSGGICYGASSVWLRLHQGLTDTPPAQRMEKMMSFNGIVASLSAQKLYNAEHENAFKSGRPVDDTELMNRSDMLGIHSQNLRTKQYTTPESYSGLDKLLHLHEGYYTLPLVFKKQDGSEARHAFNIGHLELQVILA